MRWRIRTLDEHGLKLHDIQNVISQIEPLPGAVELLEWVKEKTQLIVVSDTFIQFADPIMRQLGRPTLFCHSLIMDKTNRIIDFKMRQPDPKRRTVEALQGLKYQVVAIGDSYNDISMLKQAEEGILFRPPQNVIDEHPHFPVTQDYAEIKEILSRFIS